MNNFLHAIGSVFVSVFVGVSSLFGYHLVVVPISASSTASVIANSSPTSTKSVDVLQTSSKIGYAKTPMAIPNAVNLSIVSTPPSSENQPQAALSTDSALRPAHLFLSTDVSASNSFYNQYISLTVSEYKKNPGLYSGQGLEIEGIVNDFLPQNLNSSNFIVLDSTSSSDQMMLEIPNPTQYQAIAGSLNKGDVINVDGLGAGTKIFSTVNTFQTYNNSYPILTVQRVSRCQYGNCSAIVADFQSQAIAVSSRSLSLQTALKSASTYMNTAFTAQGVITGFVPFDSNTYAVNIQDPDYPDAKAYIIIDSSSKTKLNAGDTISFTGKFKYIGLTNLGIDTDGNPITLVRSR